MRPALVQAFLDGLSDRPATQKVAQTSLKALERWAIRLDLLPRQITLGTEAVGSKGGHKPWTEAQIRTAIECARRSFARHHGRVEHRPARQRSCQDAMVGP
jgi:hypothetical protein